APAECRSDMDFERIDEPDLGKTFWRVHSRTILQRPFATISTAPLAAISDDRNTSVRVWRVTRTRISIRSPSRPALTKSQLTETVLQDLAPETRREVRLIAISAKVISSPPCTLPAAFMCLSRAMK